MTHSIGPDPAEMASSLGCSNCCAPSHSLIPERVGGTAMPRRRSRKIHSCIEVHEPASLSLPVQQRVRYVVDDQEVYSAEQRIERSSTRFCGEVGNVGVV
jgi:hypothetical protein